MSTPDYIVLLIYLIGVFAVGVFFTGRNTTTAEMFAAGGQSPWWVAGLSGFMTMFSAGTFVVWGGIAYKYGMVAVVINICYGVSALLVGWTLAARWKRSGVKTPAEYVELRFGKAALHFYTWAIMSFKIIGAAVALYSLCILMVAMMPLSAGNPLRDPGTGNLSLGVAIVVLGGVVVLYTMIGGLWGVLMTDVLQFIVLNLAVLFVVPLALADIGGLSRFFAGAPQGFMAPTGGGYTWFFIAGWVAIHYFVVGAEWAFVQRYLCVPTPRDARKGAYLFGVLYLVSPLLWLLPPMIQRVRAPLLADASESTTRIMAESAYIDICRAVLPAGMVGLLLAAMFSATASMVSSQLNVFAGVLATDIFRPWLGNEPSESMLVWAGRGFTVLLGVLIVAIALAVPGMGGAEKVIVPATSLMVVPLLAPLLAGLISHRLPSAAVWLTAAICCGCILLVKFGLSEGGFALHVPGGARLSAWLQSLDRSSDILIGVVIPTFIVLACHYAARGVSRGWNRVETLTPAMSESSDIAASSAPSSIVAWSLVACGAIMAGLAMWTVDGRAILVIFSGLLWVLAAATHFVARRATVDGGKVGNADA